MSDADDRIEALEHVVQDLLAAAAAAPPPAPPAPPPGPPQRWADRATPDDWDGLMDWVDDLNTRYSLFADYPILPCWPAHPGVVEELAALWRAWIAATLTDAAAGAAGCVDLNTWHDRALWPTLRRLEKRHYSSSSCRIKHEMEHPSPVTDRFITG